MESKPSDLANGNLVTSKSKGLDSKKFIESFYVVFECSEIPR